MMTCIFRLHNKLIPNPPRPSNNTQAFTSGYRLNGEYFFDERVVLSSTIPSNIFHSLRMVVDKASVQSTKVFLDDTYVGSFREHFVTRLKGGVFVVNQIGSVGLFKNFSLKGCKRFDENAVCQDGKYIIPMYFFFRVSLLHVMNSKDNDFFLLFI